jgi:hypothetical protein
VHEVPTKFTDSLLLGPKEKELRCGRWVPRGDGCVDYPSRFHLDKWFCTRPAGHLGDCVAHIVNPGGESGLVAATWPREAGKDREEEQ